LFTALLAPLPLPPAEPAPPSLKPPPREVMVVIPVPDIEEFTPLLLEVPPAPTVIV
jgi:hypothetical protein